MSPRETPKVDFYRHLDAFERACCHKPKIANHSRDIEKPKFNWGENNKPKVIKYDEDGIIIPSQKIKDLRRKQFFNFISDFFEKFDRGDMKNKASPLIKFNEEEKEEWMKKYFKKYYMENEVLKDVEVRMKVDTDMAA